jgi:hypothetical protein
MMVVSVGDLSYLKSDFQNNESDKRKLDICLFFFDVTNQAAPWEGVRNTEFHENITYI